MLTHVHVYVLMLTGVHACVLADTCAWHVHVHLLMLVLTLKPLLLALHNVLRAEGHILHV